MMKRAWMVVVAFGVVAVLAGCPAGESKPGGGEAPGSAPVSAPMSAPDPAPASQPGGAGGPGAAPEGSASTGHHGTAFTLGESAPLASVLDKAAEHDGKLVRVKGTVESVCKKKGCWFVVKTEEATPRTVRITMKDYGFFVPKDCDGKVAEIEGVLERKVIPEAERKHFLEDEGKDASGVTGDAEEVRLVATGVLISG